MKAKSYKKSSFTFNKTTNNYQKVNSSVFVDSFGNSDVTTTIETGHIKTKDELRTEKRQKFNFGFTLFAKIFMVAMILLFGSYFFNGGFNSQVQATEVNTTISNELNGVNYDYNIKYVDYDYTNKINQLSALKNVFTLEVYDTFNPENLILYNNSSSPLISKAINDGWINVKTVEVTDLSGNLINIKYLNARYYFRTIYRNDPNSLIVKEFNRYVNNYNLDSYLAFKYSAKITNFDSIVNNVSVWFYRVFIILNAPIVWLGNFVYDLGVIIGFIINW